jgi:hypothetical protein
MNNNNLEAVRREYNNYRHQQQEAMAAEMANERYGNELAENQVNPEEVAENNNNNPRGGARKRRNRKSRKSARKGKAALKRKSSRKNRKTNRRR